MMELVARMLRKKRGLQSLSQKELLITYLYALTLEGKEQLNEGELADAVYRARKILPFKYDFLDKPVPYSYDLLRDTEKLRDDAHLEAVLRVVGVKSVPKYVYSLTFPGKIKAHEVFDSLPNEDKEKIKIAVKAITKM